MEALAAIALTGNVLQFAQFVSGLIAASRQVYKSKDGVSDITADMEIYHRRLLNFSTILLNQVPAPQVVRPVTAIGVAHINAVNDLANDLARECTVLCDQLLKTTGKLSAEKKGNRKRDTFIKAFETVWNRDRIESLYVRLDRFQSLVSMYFLPALSTQQSNLIGMVEMLRKESNSLRLDQTEKLNCISKALSEVASTNEKLRADIALGSNPRHILENNQRVFLSPSSLNSLSRGISRLAVTNDDIEVISKEQAVLRSLNFSSRPVRYDNIPLAHEETFRWVLEPPLDDDRNDHGNNRPQHRFLDWLKGGDGIFWVSGKAGSGKSTLMKFVADHETTRTTLEEWASPLKPLTATHYFWSAGTQMQKSHEGLLKTLLYEIFRACPGLIPAACPLRWRQTHPGRKEQNTDWTTHELSEALQALASNKELRAQARYCFFIDGVDEFDGDHLRLCEILQNLGRSPNIKLCLSSRPWNVFLDAFGSDVCRKICIEDLTRGDILRYAQSRLMEHPRWNLPHLPAQDKTAIIDSITNKAQGVFLWVFLVTRSLRDGLTNLDTMLDLRNRLESLPTDLERFFRHMLDHIDDVYHVKMASFLSIAANAKQPLYYLTFSMQERESEDEDYATKMAISVTPRSEADQLYERCRRRINAICGGLLDVKGDSVEFLHRTVRDFLLTREMSDYLCSKTRPGFSVALSTLQAYTACLKCSAQLVPTSSSCPLRLRLLEEGLSYAHEALEDAEETAIELLDGIENVFASPLEEDGEYALGWKLLEPGELDGHNIVGDVNFWNASCDFQFRKEVLRAGAAKYVSRKLHECPNYFDDLNELPLSTVIREQQWTEGHMQVIRCLLDVDQDPNKGDCGRQSTSSPWTSFIQRTCREEHKDDFHAAIENGLYSTFLHRGAARDAQIVPFAESTASNALSCFVEMLFARQVKHSDKALRILEDFFDLSFGAQLPDEVLITLCAEVGKIGPRTTRPDRLRFYQKITEIAVRAGESLGWDMSFLRPNIQKAFPGVLGASLLVMVGVGDGLEGARIVTPKRKAQADVWEKLLKRTKANMEELDEKDPSGAVLDSIFF